jgi:electron transport complex protein RnfB
MRNTPSIDDINALLPQTQCQECGFKGCKPYAAALSNKETTINRCPPGGEKTLQALGNLLGIDSNPYVKELQEKYRPFRVAVIEESLCIGCTKCIDACPVDAIVGTGKMMHTVIAAECTGCGLCVEPCPMDCIEMKTLPEQDTAGLAPHWKMRHETHLARQKSAPTLAASSPVDFKSAIQASLERAQKKITSPPAGEVEQNNGLRG